MPRALLPSWTLVLLLFAACNSSDKGKVEPCGNGILDAGESCDGDCPTTCVPDQACMVGTLSGSAGQCNALCSFAPETQCFDDDGCCPDGCEATGDRDCRLCDAAPPEGVLVDLPADEAAHSEDLEWWYWTGHLQAEDGRLFGFQVTVFLSSSGGMWGRVGHHALTDISDESFHFVSTLAVGRPPEVADGYDLAVPRITAEGGPEGDRLHAEVDDYVLDLDVASVKAPVYQHGVGFTEYSFGGNTYYYSRERMMARGTLRRGEEELAVTGTAWFDHQWGELYTAQSIGWDWFALQLDDEREIMIFIIRDGDSPAMVGASYTDAECNTEEVPPEEVSVTATAQWTSPDTGRVYPAGWDVTVREMTFHVEPALADQELHDCVPGVDYWEGACVVSGDAPGRAYVELTGY